METVNLTHAWNRLCHHYNDDYMAVQTLIQKLLNMPKMQRASSESLRNISVTVHGCLSQLGAYVSTASWDPLIIFLIVDKLDNDTRKDWEKLRHTLPEPTDAHGSNQSLNVTQNVNATDAEETEGAVGGATSSVKTQVTLPTWAQMEKFLDQQSKILRDVASSQASSSNVQQNAPRSNARQQQKAQNTQNNERYNENLPPCLLCRAKHPTFSCATWKSMKMDDREMLCITCAQPSHGRSPCWGKPNWAKRCPTCWDAAREEVFHNSTLCRRAEAKRLAKQVLAMSQASNTGAKPKLKKQ